VTGSIDGWIGAGALLVAALLGTPVPAQTHEPTEIEGEHRLTWREGWRRVGPVEYTSTGLLGAGILALHWVDPPTEEHWGGPILHDD
jgi:hypothetical protein